MSRFPKLIRDRIPDLIRARGANPELRQAHPSELMPLLIDKLFEESQEVAENTTIEELADVLEVVHSIGLVTGCSWDSLIEAMVRKREEKGGFLTGTILLTINEPGE